MSLPDSFLVRELIRLELIYARQKDDRFRGPSVDEEGEGAFCPGDVAKDNIRNRGYSVAVRKDRSGAGNRID